MISKSLSFADKRLTWISDKRIENICPMRYQTINKSYFKKDEVGLYQRMQQWHHFVVFSRVAPCDRNFCIVRDFLKKNCCGWNNCDLWCNHAARNTVQLVITAHAPNRDTLQQSSANWKQMHGHWHADTYPRPRLYPLARLV